MLLNFKSELKKIQTIVDKKIQFKLILLIILLAFSGLMEMVGIGLIPVIINLVLNFKDVLEAITNYLNQFYLLEKINFEYLNFELFLLLILFFFLLKNIFFLFVAYFESKLEYELKKSISNKLFYKYIYSPYEKLFSRKNSSEIIRNLAVEISNCSAYFNAIINFSRELIVFIFIIVLLFFVNFKITFISTLFFISIVTIYFFFIKKKVKYSGEKYIKLKEIIIRKISQMIFSIKEIFIYQNENLIYDNFKKDIDNYEKIIFFINFIKKVPRILLEVISIGLIIFFLIYFIKIYNQAEVITIASLIGLSVIRLIPSINTMSNSFISLKYFSASFNTIYKEFLNTKKFDNKKNNLNKKILASTKFTNINFEKIFFKYPKKEYIFKNFNFNINHGELIKVIGPSGSGKTTFLNLLSGLITSFSGKIIFQDKNLNQYLNQKQIKSLFSYVPQETFILDDSIKNNILFGSREDKKKLNQSLKQANIYEFVKKLKYGINTKCGEKGIQFSGGQRQRIAIARAIYSDRPILLFDEITNGLDLTNENKIIKTINSLRRLKTIIFITHKKNNLLKADKILNFK